MLPTGKPAVEVADIFEAQAIHKGYRFAATAIGKTRRTMNHVRFGTVERDQLIYEFGTIEIDVRGLTDMTHRVFFGSTNIQHHEAGRRFYKLPCLFGVQISTNRIKDWQETSLLRTVGGAMLGGDTGKK